MITAGIDCKQRDVTKALSRDKAGLTMWRSSTLRFIVVSLLATLVMADFSALAQEPVTQSQLTIEERIFGLAKFWSEAKFNFVYWNKLPDLDWDKAFQDYLTLVMKAQDDAEYWRLMLRFAALLKDGHTGVTPPPNLFDRPPLLIQLVEGRRVITDFALTPEIQQANLKPGTEILEVEDCPVEEYLAEEILPYISASREESRRAIANPLVLVGKKGTPVKLKLRDPGGEMRTVTLIRDSTLPDGSRWPPPRLPFVKHSLGDGIYHVELNTFGTEDVVRSFDQAFPDFKGVRGLILDLRYNGGGNAWFGFEIFGRLIEKPVANLKWKSRKYVPAYRSWGQPEEWVEGEPSPLYPRQGFDHFHGPVVLLTGVRTGSAAEDFVAVFRGARRGLIVGEATNGSTGQPLIFDLPGGGRGWVVTKTTTFADGTEFVGVGIKPDVEVKPTVADIVQGRDPVLESAIELLKQQAQETAQESSRGRNLLGVAVAALIVVLLLLVKLR